MYLENGHNAQHRVTYASSTMHECIGGTSEHPAVEEVGHWLESKWVEMQDMTLG